MGSVTRIPSLRWYDRGDAPAVEPEWIDCDVPDHGAVGSARRPWFSDRWRAFHLLDPTAAEGAELTTRLHHQLRRRRA